MVGVLVVILGLCAALASFARVSTDAERVRLAADQAALAGAAVVLGAAGASGSPSIGENPCEAARVTAERNGAELVTCRELSTGVQVEVTRPTIADRDVRAVARAGEGPQAADGAAASDADGPAPARGVGSHDVGFTSEAPPRGAGRHTVAPS